MGTVYGAESPAGERVAVKVIRQEAVNVQMMERFVREASIRIEHPNVISVLDAGQDDDGTPFIVFELLEGMALDARLEKGALPPQELVSIAVQTCDGLAAAHAAGVIHRDLKPANLFCCADDTVKVLDFGIARVTAGATLTGTSVVIGTLSYLSPEQARGARDVDLRTDIWAMGALMYGALSGRAPFDRDQPVATLLAIIQDEPEPLAEIAPRVPPALADVVHRCLDKRPEGRFGSAEALRDALVAVRDGWPAAVRGDEETLPASGLEAGGGIRPGEQRVVAILRAQRVRDPHVLEQEVLRRGGVPIRLLGGNFLGLFGTKGWRGDEVAAAVAAAVHSRHCAERMAVAAGRARAGERGIAGEALEAAERGCAAAMMGVAVDAGVARSVGSRFSVREFADGLMEVVGEQGETWHARAMVEGHTVGRERELNRLRDLLGEMLADRTMRTVVVTGSVGVGKSRLRRDLETYIELCGESVRVLKCNAQSSEREAALSLFSSGLRRRLSEGMATRGWPRLGHDASLLERQQAIVTLVGEAIAGQPNQMECAEMLGELLGVPMPESASLASARNDPQLMADRMQGALLDYIGGLCRLGPVALLLEDVHWADPTSLQLLERLAETLFDAPLLLLATCRAEQGKPIVDVLPGGERDHLMLDGLSPARVGDLVERLAGRAVSERVLRGIIDRTGGNPLFIEQVVMALRESGGMEGDVTDVPLPITVEAALQSRIDALPEAEGQLCKCASVFGRPAELSELEAVGVADVNALIRSLSRKGLVRLTEGSRTAGSHEVRFRSEVMGLVCYRMMAPELRKRLHSRVAERLAAGQVVDEEEVAVHLERGGDLEQAARRFALAAVRAAVLGDAATVLRCSDRAIDLGVPDDLRFSVRMARADTLRFLGKRGVQARELELAMGAASTDGERARCLTEQTVWCSRVGQTEDALRIGQEAIEAADRSGDAEAQALARVRRAGALIRASRLEDAAAALGEATGYAERASAHTQALLAELRARLAAVRGDVGERSAAFVEASALFREIGDVRRAAANEANVADAYNRVGGYAEAEEALNAALEGCRRVGNRLFEGYALANRGYAQLMLGKAQDAVGSLADADRIAGESQDARLMLTIRAYLARVMASVGDADGVLGQALAVAEDARRVGQPTLEVMALTTAARLSLRAGDVQQALEHSARALRVRDEAGEIEEGEEDLFLVRVDALRDADRAEEAEEVLVRARSRLRYVADRIRDPQWRARFLTDVAAHRVLLGTG